MQAVLADSLELCRKFILLVSWPPVELFQNSSSRFPAPKKICYQWNHKHYILSMIFFHQRPHCIFTQCLDCCIQYIKVKEDIQAPFQLDFTRKSELLHGIMVCQQVTDYFSSNNELWLVLAPQNYCGSLAGVWRLLRGVECAGTATCKNVED